MNKILKILIYFSLLSALFFILSIGVSATSCWNLDSQTTCEADTDCQWKSDPWGSWCEEKGCWNFWDQTACQNSTNSINKSCSWSSTSSGWCGEVNCWNYDGTNQSACESNSKGLDCTWVDTYDASSWDYPCMGPPEKGCWEQTTQSTCTAIPGCTWGACEQKSCWDYSSSTQATCEAQTGHNGNACKWEVRSWGTECMEGGCWDYNNKTGCEANNCNWEGSYCTDVWCGSFSGTTAAACVNNSNNLSCSWDSNGEWCSDNGCWNYNTEGTCGNQPDCNWESYEGGWCQEQGCWNWDNNETYCTNTTAHPGISCVFDNTWCYENVTSKSCTDITVEKNCLDTLYCWWNYTASPGTCNEPTGTIVSEHNQWNPGCYIFDMDQSLCTNTTGCDWDSTNSKCTTNTTIIPNNQLNCTLINNQSTCNSIPALSNCCAWQAGSCAADKYDFSCWEQMEEPPEGAYYCEDYNSYTDQTLCEQIAGSPWFMPCKWSNSTDRCEFKDSDVFTSGEKNIMTIDNEKNCEAAGGKWIIDTYPSTNNASTAVRMSLGRCDYKFNEERNCNKECYACEFKTDKTAWSSSAEAKKACVDSELGMCGFTADTTAPNSYGFCEPKNEFKQKLISGDCDSDCSACTYMGDPGASKGKKPSDYCINSKNKCKWLADPAHPDDESYGRCASKSEKTCEDKCDKCYDETSCKNNGGKNGNSSASAVCQWDDGLCSYKSGADQMEICWDGIDNNGDNKIDCADSMCWSDPFCGGGYMFDDFGTDCFIYDSNETACTNAGCAWVNENWGSWCDMPGAVCWKKDGNQTGCDADSNCEWHSGFGGFCEQDWDVGTSCFGYDDNQTACEAASATNNCTWVVDNWCQDVGGWCEGYSAYAGTEFQDCWQYNGQSACEAATDSSNLQTCQWKEDSWCQTQGAGAGWCDHKSFACWQYNTTTCTNSSNTAFCAWKTDQYSPDGGWCEGKMMGGGSGSCWESTNSSTCTAAGCNWVSGFCDPVGFGGQSICGGTGGGTATGGFGMQCFKYDANQSGCQNQTGCGWFTEPEPFCDINFASNCPQYSYDQTACNNATLTGDRCKWNSVDNFCDEKPFECFWNTTLKNNFTLCNQHSLCYNNSNNCEPLAFNATTQSQCTNYNATLFKWVSGWCNPAMASEFFNDMDMGGPPVPLGTDSADSGIEDEVDISSFGIKDMGNALGFGITVVNPTNGASCNNVKLSSGLSTGENTTKFYWYLDTDGSTTGNCALRHDSSAVGYEFYIKNEWSYDSTTGTVTESPAAYRCSSGSWSLAEIRVSSEKHLMCDEIGGAMVAIEKTELEKFPSLYSATSDIRVSVASADSSGNVTNPTDTASAGWLTPGTQDFEIIDMYAYEKDWIKKSSNEAADEGFIDYGEDADCWTAAGCADYSCKGHAYCVENNLGVEAAGFLDTKIPKVIGAVKETYPDSAFMAYFTDKPSNGSLFLYGNNTICKESALTDTINDIGVYSSNSQAYKLWHLAEIYNDGGTNSLSSALTNGTTYYYKIKVCDDAGKCGISKCSNFTTSATIAACPFCKFVSRISAPSGWNVYYDLDQDSNYEHWQGNVLGPEDGMFTNYTDGRKANILMNTTDGTSHIEFFNVTLTKTGMGPKIRNITGSTALKDGTTTDADGDTVGYTGMIEETKDKIIHNLYPESCQIKIPGSGTCDQLWHCDNDLDNCINKTSSATLISNTSTSCVWQVPYCEFSTWAGGQPSTSSSSSSGGGGGGGGGSAAQCNNNKDDDGDGLTDYPNDPGCASEKDTDETDASICTQSWSCTAWSECTNNIQTRACSEDNDCLTKKGAGEVDQVIELSKPLETKDCSAAPETITAEPAPEVPPAQDTGITGAAVTNSKPFNLSKEGLMGLALLGGLVIVVVIIQMRKPKVKFH